MTASRKQVKLGENPPGEAGPRAASKTFFVPGSVITLEATLLNLERRPKKRLCGCYMNNRDEPKSYNVVDLVADACLCSAYLLPT